MGIRATHKYNLQIVNPALAKQWHPKKNFPLTPREVTPCSNKKVWWICKKQHKWRTTVNNRHRLGRNCPYCANQKVNMENSLALKYPELVKEWHPTKNGKLTPSDFVPASGKKAWWQCKRGHEWESVIYTRAKIGCGCPHCNSQTSMLELRVYSELKHIFNDASLRAKISKIECDIFIPSLRLAIEVDGKYWHKNKRVKDAKKNLALKKMGIALIRIREHGLIKISDLDIVCSNREKEIDTILRVLRVVKRIRRTENKTLNIYLDKRKIINEGFFEQLLGRLPSPLPGTSLAELNNRLAKEWHPTKNGTLTSNDVALQSNKKIWWICKKGHEWRTTVNNRSKGKNCPFCGHKKITLLNSLYAKFPKLAKEWHPAKNGIITPSDVFPGSNKKIWWICKNGHEWQAGVVHRVGGSGCPYCSGRLADKNNNLLIENPKLAKEWHKIKNGVLEPKDVKQSSGKVVWWICKRGHQWSARVADRNNGTGCPYCDGKKVCKDNCLATKNPTLADEWHPIKNRPLTPEGVAPHSNRKAWWKCKKNHQWLATVSSRNQGSGCPYCSGRFASETNNLKLLYPKLSKEWHSTKNGRLTPRDVTAHSGKEYWWKCKNGHEWKRTIDVRSRGGGCPYCSRRIKLNK